MNDLMKQLREAFMDGVVWGRERDHWTTAEQAWEQYLKDRQGSDEPQ